MKGSVLTRWVAIGRGEECWKQLGLHGRGQRAASVAVPCSPGPACTPRRHSAGCGLESMREALAPTVFPIMALASDPTAPPPPLEKTLMLGKIEGRRSRGRQRMRWLEDSVDMSLSILREIVEDGEAWRVAVHGVTKSQTRLSN